MDSPINSDNIKKDDLYISGENSFANLSQPSDEISNQTQNEKLLGENSVQFQKNLDAQQVTPVNIQTDLDSFNAFTTKLFIKKYSTLKDATSSLINIIKNIPLSKSEKISNIAINLNINIQEIQELTFNKNRIIRFISTNIIYKYIIFNYKNNNLTYINEVFTSTFLHRYKDVDPNIRCLSFEFIVNFVFLNVSLFYKYIEFIYLGLKDKNDLIRKSILIELRKSILNKKSLKTKGKSKVKCLNSSYDNKDRLQKVCSSNISDECLIINIDKTEKSTNKKTLKNKLINNNAINNKFINIDKKIIIDLCKYDKNTNVRNEAFKVISVYFMNGAVFSEDDIFEVLKFICDGNGAEYGIFTVYGAKDGINNNCININSGLNDNVINNNNDIITRNCINNNMICSVTKNTKPIIEILTFMLKTDFNRILHRLFNTSKQLLQFIQIPPDYKCDCKCFLEIYKIKKVSLSISEINYLLQENLNYTSTITKFLQYSTIDDIQIFINVLNTIMKYVQTNLDFTTFDYLCKYLYTIQNDYKSIIETLLGIELDATTNENDNNINSLGTVDKINIFVTNLSNERSLYNNTFYTTENPIYKYYIIKYFNISSFVTDQDFLETQVYKLMWLTLERNFLKINLNNYKWYSKKEICNLILFIKDKIGKVDIKYFNEEKFIEDEMEFLNLLYIKLLQYVENVNGENNFEDCVEGIEDRSHKVKNEISTSVEDNLNKEFKNGNFGEHEDENEIFKNNTHFLDEDNLFLYIYKFNEENILEHRIYLLFKYVDDLETFTELYTRSKNKRNLVKSFFKWITFLSNDKIFNKDLNSDKLNKESNVDKINKKLNKTKNWNFILFKEIGKLINTRYKETGFYFKNIKYVLEKNNNINLYGLLEIFINKLNVNECIVLENILKDSKFKKLIVKKIEKSKNLDRENVDKNGKLFGDREILDKKKHDDKSVNKEKINYENGNEKKIKLHNIDKENINIKSVNNKFADEKKLDKESVYDGSEEKITYI